MSNKETTFREFLAEEMKDPEFKREYEPMLSKERAKLNALTIREAKKLRKELQELSDSILLFFHGFDQLMKQPSTPERGKEIAKLSNWLDMKNDGVRYNSLGVNFRTDDKDKAVAKLLKKLRK